MADDSKTQAVARAVEESAKAVQAVAPEVSAMATYLARLVGTVPEDFVDIVLGQPLRHLRVRTGIWWAERTYEYVTKRGIEHPKHLSAKGVIAVFEAATEEADESILDLWARLMANAIDPNRDTSLSRQLIATLKEFEPDDAIVFDVLGQVFHDPANTRIGHHDRVNMAEARLQKLRWRTSRLQVSKLRIEKLGVYRGGDQNLTQLGQELWHAVRDDGEA